MNSKGVGALMFLAGAAVGAVSAWFITSIKAEKKYKEYEDELNAMETYTVPAKPTKEEQVEIDYSSLQKEYSGESSEEESEIIASAITEERQSKSTKKSKDEEEEEEHKATVAMSGTYEDKPDISEIAKRGKSLLESGTVVRKRSNKKTKKPDSKINIIPEVEFGELDEDYECISLTYYADDVVTDDNNEPIEHPEDIIGEEVLERLRFGEDTVFYVRNDNLSVDYEILRDYRTYESLPPYSY